MAGQGVREHGEDIVVHAVLFQQRLGCQDAPVRPLPGGVQAILIMDGLHGVQRKADEKAVLFEKGAPFFIQHRAVGLQGVAYSCLSAYTLDL